MHFSDNPGIKMLHCLLDRQGQVEEEDVLNKPKGLVSLSQLRLGLISVED